MDTLNVMDLDTPAIYVDLDVMERNIRTMQERCRGWGVGLRPHTKTHKIPEIAKMQLEAGAVGLTVAKIGEAEVMPGEDILIGYPLMAEKLGRLREFASRRKGRVTVLADSPDAARALAGAGVGVLVEMDVGVHRMGVQSTADALAVAKAAGSQFRGVFYWPSWLDLEGFKHARTMLDETVGALEAGGFRCEMVSGGSTPGADKTPLVPRTTEIRPGTYVFYDVNSLSTNLCALEECALKVLVTVVSTAVPGQCIIDGGSKTFSSDATINKGTFGTFPGHQWTMKKMNEEHGYVTIESPAKVGEKVWAIPSHVCPTVNLHDEIHYGRNRRVEGSWKVAARGKVR